MKRIYTLLMSLVLVLGAMAQQTPSVSIQNFTQPTPTSIAYDVAVNSDCDRYVYVHADTSIANMYQQMGMTLEQFMESLMSYGLEWITCTPGQIDHYEFSDFEPNATYGAYVYAKNAAGEGTVVVHTFTTGTQGGDGEAQLAMAITHPQNDKVHIDITINDQTAYYWYTTLDQQLLDQMGLSMATATTQDYYDVMDQLINTHGMSYFVHTSNISEDFTVGTNIEYGEEYVAVAFPFNANGELGTYTEPTRFSAGSANIITADSDHLQLYPNPAHGKVNITSAQPMRMIEVVDLSGRTVLSKQCYTLSQQLDIAHLTSGIYIVKVCTTQGISLQKLIIE